VGALKGVDAALGEVVVVALRRASRRRRDRRCRGGRGRYGRSWSRRWRDDGKRFVARSDEKLTAFLELESATRNVGVKHAQGIVEPSVRRGLP
jgi:hypothetical protein